MLSVFRREPARNHQFCGQLGSPEVRSDEMRLESYFCGVCSNIEHEKKRLNGYNKECNENWAIIAVLLLDENAQAYALGSNLS